MADYIPISPDLVAKEEPATEDQAIEHFINYEPNLEHSEDEAWGCKLPNLAWVLESMTKRKLDDTNPDSPTDESTNGAIEQNPFVVQGVSGPSGSPTSPRESHRPAKKQRTGLTIDTTTAHEARQPWRVVTPDGTGVAGGSRTFEIAPTNDQPTRCLLTDDPTGSPRGPRYFEEAARSSISDDKIDEVIIPGKPEISRIEMEKVRHRKQEQDDPVHSMMEETIDDIKYQALNIFERDHQDAVADDMANAVSDVLGGVLASTVWDVGGLIESRDAIVGHMEGFHTRLNGLDEAFTNYQKRASQKEIRKQVSLVKAEVQKLRTPDVTLEMLKAKIAGFERDLRRQDKLIDGFKSNCAAELGRLAKARTSFNAEVKGRKSKVQEDVKDLSGRLDGLEDILERLEDAVDEIAGKVDHGAELSGRLDELEQKIAMHRQEVDDDLVSHLQEQHERIQHLEESQSNMQSAMFEFCLAFCTRR